MYMLQLCGYVLHRDPSSVQPSEERLKAIVSGRQLLRELTEQDFGYDLSRWHAYLLENEGEWGYTHPYAWSGVQKAVEKALGDPSLLRLLDELGDPFRTTQREAACLNPTVQQIASTIHEHNAFDRMPILADALEDAGCTSANILQHCRQPGEHVRGCWVLDLILGKQ
jgi:hypothetical protein